MTDSPCKTPDPSSIRTVTLQRLAAQLEKMEKARKGPVVGPRGLVAKTIQVLPLRGLSFRESGLHRYRGLGSPVA